MVAIVLVSKVVEVLVKVPFEAIEVDPEDAKDEAEWLQSSLMPPIKVTFAD